MTINEDPVQAALAEGEALLDMGRAADAAAAFAKAVSADPQNSEAYAGLAAAELTLDHMQEAREAAQSALALDPENAQASRIQSVALLRLGEKQDAHREALRAVELEPEAIGGYVVLADALTSVGDLAGAEKAAQVAIEIAPDFSAGWSTLALVKLRQEEWAAAEQAAKQALRLNPENAATLNNLAVALRRQHRNGEAAEVFERAARTSPNNKTVRQNLLRLRHTGARRHLSKPTRTLIADDTRARRYQPQRWDWGRTKRLRPWWWIMLKRIPAPHALAVNVALLALFLATALSSSNRQWGWVVILGLALPFSTARAWKWWRIRHPGPDSWTPPVIVERTTGGEGRPLAEPGSTATSVPPPP